MFGRGARACIPSEPGALAAALSCGSVRAVPLGRGPMAIHITGIGLGDVLLQTARSTPVALLGTLSRATVLLALPLDGREATALNGRALQPRCVAAFGAGARYEAASARDCAWATVVLSAATAGALLGRRRLPPALHPGAHALLRASPAAWARAEALARDASEVAAQDPGVFEVEEARRALRSAVLETADELLASPAYEEPVRTRQARTAHRQLVRLVDDHVTAAPARIAGVAELSAALGVSERQMREAFAGVLGVSPSRYLRLRRLVLVRAALRSPGRSWPTVCEAALAHGFWHLGRFSRIYRDAYGEPPSTTLGGVAGRAGAELAECDPPGSAADGNGTAPPALSVLVRPEDQEPPMSRPRPVENDRAMERPDRCGDRLAATKPLYLPGLAYECESLVVRDPLLPPALLRNLLDVAIALREEADRRRRGGSGGADDHRRPALTP